MDECAMEEAIATAAVATAAAKPKPKRPERERKKKVRFELLHSMTVEQRRQYLLDEEANAVAKAEKMRRAVESDGGVQRIAIDLSFDAIMNEKEIHSLAKQMKLSYGAVKQMEKPFQLHFLNCSAALKQSLERFSADKWLVHWHTGDDSSSGDGAGHHHLATEIAAPESIVYLSPDSPNVLTSLDATKTYVIGGIVDKSRKKVWHHNQRDTQIYCTWGATLNAASSAGITTARLPIQEFITERLDHILNVNTVIEVLIAFEETGGDWAKALRLALPQRKQSQVGRKARRKQAKAANEEEDNEAQVHLDSEVKSSSIDAVNPTQVVQQQSNLESHDVETKVESIIDKLQV